MKKIIFSLVLTCFSLTILFAQVPMRVQETFKTKYPDVTVVKWTSEGDYYKVTYTDSRRVQNIAIFDKDAKIVRTEAEMDMKDYPVAVREYYEKKYPGEKTYHVWVVTDASGDKTYYIRSHDRVTFFDKAGKFLRETKEEMKEERKELKEEIKEEKKDIDK